jgi:hypothetical protein
MTGTLLLVATIVLWIAVIVAVVDAWHAHKRWPE